MPDDPAALRRDLDQAQAAIADLTQRVRNQWTPEASAELQRLRGQYVAAFVAWRRAVREADADREGEPLAAAA